MVELLLEKMKADRTNELEALKDQRQAECVSMRPGHDGRVKLFFTFYRIETRLLEKGWKHEDFRHLLKNYTAWSHLVHQPKPFTDRSK